MKSHQFSVNPSTVIYASDLEPWMDHTYLQNIFQIYGVIKITIATQKQTGISLGWAILEFTTPENTMQVFDTFNGKQMPSAQSKATIFNFRFAPAQQSQPPPVTSHINSLLSPKYGNLQQKSNIANPDFAIYVGNLSEEVSEQVLLCTFSSRYGSAYKAKIIVDPATKKSRGYGFVNFRDYSEAESAITEMNGLTIGSKQIKINKASLKKVSSDADLHAPSPFYNQQMGGGVPQILQINTNPSASAGVHPYYSLGEHAHSPLAHTPSIHTPPHALSQTAYRSPQNMHQYSGSNSPTSQEHLLSQYHSHPAPNTTHSFSPQGSSTNLTPTHQQMSLHHHSTSQIKKPIQQQQKQRFYFPPAVTEGETQEYPKTRHSVGGFNLLSSQMQSQSHPTLLRPSDAAKNTINIAGASAKNQGVIQSIYMKVGHNPPMASQQQLQQHQQHQHQQARKRSSDNNTAPTNGFAAIREEQKNPFQPSVNNTGSATHNFNVIKTDQNFIHNFPNLSNISPRDGTSPRGQLSAGAKPFKPKIPGKGDTQQKDESEDTK